MPPLDYPDSDSIDTISLLAMGQAVSQDSNNPTIIRNVLPTVILEMIGKRADKSFALNAEVLVLDTQSQVVDGIFVTAQQTGIIDPSPTGEIVAGQITEPVNIGAAGLKADFLMYPGGNVFLQYADKEISVTGGDGQGALSLNDYLPTFQWAKVDGFHNRPTVETSAEFDTFELSHDPAPAHLAQEVKTDTYGPLTHAGTEPEPAHPAHIAGGGDFTIPARAHAGSEPEPDHAALTIGGISVPVLTHAGTEPEPAHPAQIIDYIPPLTHEAAPPHTSENYQVDGTGFLPEEWDLFHRESLFPYLTDGLRNIVVRDVHSQVKSTSAANPLTVQGHQTGPLDDGTPIYSGYYPAGTQLKVKQYQFKTFQIMFPFIGEYTMPIYGDFSIYIKMTHPFSNKVLVEKRFYFYGEFSANPDSIEPLAEADDSSQTKRILLKFRTNIPELTDLNIQAQGFNNDFFTQFMDDAGVFQAGRSRGETGNLDEVAPPLF